MSHAFDSEEGIVRTGIYNVLKVVKLIIHTHFNHLSFGFLFSASKEKNVVSA